jgi:hypothetical protein
MVVGPALQWVVRADGGQELLVRQQRSGSDAEGETIREGDRVVVTWTDDAALALDTRGEGGEQA